MCVPRATSNVLRLPLWFSVLQGRCRANTGAVETFLIVSSWTRCSPSNQGCGLSPLETRSANQGQTQHARSGHIGLVSSRAPPATRRGHQQDWQETARQDINRGTPGGKSASTSSPTGSPSQKPVTTGKTPPACRARQPRPRQSSSRTVTSKPNTRQPAKPLIYMALRWTQAGRVSSPRAWSMGARVSSGTLSCTTGVSRPVCLGLGCAQLGDLQWNALCADDQLIP